MRSPPILQPLRCPYAEFYGGSFRSHDRTVFSIIVIIFVVFLVMVIFLYTRWVCRLRASRPLRRSASAVRHFQPQPSPRRGLDLSEIEKMPMVLYKNLTGGGGRFYEAECCICLGAFAGKEEVKVLPQCRHCFHSECLDKWLITQSSCPLCRASLRVDSLD